MIINHTNIKFYVRWNRNEFKMGKIKQKKDKKKKETDMALGMDQCIENQEFLSSWEYS